MNRISEITLKEWFLKKKRAPLLLRGARQIGKTWLVREFSKKYDLIEINFESHPEFRSLFLKNFGKPHLLVKELELFFEKKIIIGQTILFLDEIQECEEALLSLRYFKEELQDLHVVGAGSLLEFTLKKISFPVGRIEFLHLFPMNFEEFLIEKGHSKWCEAIKKHDWNSGTPFYESIHSRLIDLVKDYILLGGMPAVLKSYFLEESPTEVQNQLQILTSNYRADFSKYATHAKVEYVRQVFDSIPKILGEKFKYSKVNADAGSRELSHALELLECAGLTYRVPHTSASQIPLSSEENRLHFKSFFLDSGLALRVMGCSLSNLFRDKEEYFRNGGLMEQFIAQEFLSYTPKNETPSLHYWKREEKSSQAEIDLLIEKEGSVIPIEVKSGKTSKIKSLKMFLEMKKKVKTALVFYDGQSKVDDKITHLPFYATMAVFTR